MRRNWIWFSMAAHVAAILFSVGYYDLDEHFQILEFGFVRAGGGSAKLLPWEYASQIRPWLMPGIFEFLLKASRILLGAQASPFWAVFALRALSGALGLAATIAVVRWAEGAGYRFTTWVVRWICGLWCLPYLHARASSEAWAGSLLALGFVALGSLKPQAPIPPRALVRSAAFLGLAWLCRYQAAFAIVSLGLWLVLFTPDRLRLVTRWGGTLLLFIGLGACLDRWGYGVWTFSAWNYFESNILHGVASSFGEQGFGHYWWDLGTQVRPLGWLLGAGVIAGWILRPRDALTWMTLGFVGAHHLIAHKELRFLFTAATLAPLVAARGYEGLIQRASWMLRITWVRQTLSWAHLLVFVLSLGAATAGAIKPSTNYIRFYRLLWAHAGQIGTLGQVGPEPFVLGGNTVQVYRPPGLQSAVFSTWGELRTFLGSEVRSRGKAHFFWPRNHFDAEPTLRTSLLPLKCEVLLSSFPRWMKTFEFFEGVRVNMNRWSVWECVVSP